VLIYVMKLPRISTDDSFFSFGLLLRSSVEVLRNGVEISMKSWHGLICCAVSVMRQHSGFRRFSTLVFIISSVPFACFFSYAA